MNHNDRFENAVCDAIAKLDCQSAADGGRGFTKVWGLHALLELGRRGTAEQSAYIFANADRLIKFCERKERSHGALLTHINKRIAK